MIKNWIISVATAIAMRLLETIPQALWDGFWAVIIESVKQAEEKYGRGLGEQKREQVIGQALEYVMKIRKLNAIQRWALKLFLGRVIDSIIAELNKMAGHNWVNVVDQIKDRLAAKIPFVK